ncbi:MULTISPECIES: hypothetical protein [unclassified Janthinobacterium]|uniref:hypothetical protein n=1 Tax=unclassified Janthinobacterium TaxID=2610881 RepID=UPI0003483C00|nr:MULTISPECIES: hypothetical protein [unclassified Janthinobacterium]MEC5160268.1 hypothetical protein [Janthinobacterium sp. CG_S6]
MKTILFLSAGALLALPARDRLLNQQRRRRRPPAAHAGDRAPAEGDCLVYLHKRHAALRKVKRDGTHRAIVEAIMQRDAR